MEKIDRHWIKSRMTGKWGEASSLARHLGCTSATISKMLSGNRRVQAHEVPLILSFFGVADAVGQIAALEARIVDLESLVAGLEERAQALNGN